MYHVTFDSIGNEVIPTFHTETVKVFDTVKHVKISNTKRRYTYLHVPLLVGYMQELRRIDWFVKTGPSLLVMVDKHIPDVMVSEEDYRLLAESSEFPSRIDLQWHYTISAGISYKMGNNFSLNVEPVFRFHIDPAYKRNTISTRNPYSLGLRMGLLLNF